MIKVIRDERTKTEIQIFFTAPACETELNAACIADQNEKAFYSDPAETDSEYAENTTAWD